MTAKINGKLIDESAQHNWNQLHTIPLSVYPATYKPRLIPVLNPVLDQIAPSIKLATITADMAGSSGYGAGA